MLDVTVDETLIHPVSLGSIQLPCFGLIQDNRIVQSIFLKSSTVCFSLLGMPPPHCLYLVCGNPVSFGLSPPDPGDRYARTRRHPYDLLTVLSAGTLHKKNNAWVTYKPAHPLPTQYLGPQWAFFLCVSMLTIMMCIHVNHIHVYPC